jgi:hypothetical protein
MTEITPRLSKNVLPWRTEEDLLMYVRWAMRLSGTIEIVISPGKMLLLQMPGDTALEPMPKLPSDDIFKRLSTDEGTPQIEIVRRKTTRDSFFASMVDLHQHGLFPTHLAGRTRPEIAAALRIPDAPFENLAESRHLLGIEVATSAELEEGVFLLCGGPRKDGSVADITRVLRLEEE